MICGQGSTVGEKLIQDKRLKLISFTGSNVIGRRILTVVHSRFARTIFELGGNNALVVMDDADTNMALVAALFTAVGTCGQRCTSLRRVIINEKAYDHFIDKLKKGYATIKIWDPLNTETLIGPLYGKNKIKEYLEGLKEIKKQGGKII